MARPDEAFAPLRKGLDRVEISDHVGVTVMSVLDYLDRKIGAGELRRSDLYFSVPKKRRAAARSRHYLEVVQRYADAASAYGDMYHDIRGIETLLHKLVRERLGQTFGREESGWWRLGVRKGSGSSARSAGRGTKSL